MRIASNNAGESSRENKSEEILTLFRLEAGGGGEIRNEKKAEPSKKFLLYENVS
jgi:hypothetical protein